jgi:hypothetical protein
MSASLKNIAEKPNVSTTMVSWILSGQSDERRIGAVVQDNVMKCALKVHELKFRTGMLAKRRFKTNINRRNRRKIFGFLAAFVIDTGRWKYSDQKTALWTWIV